MHLVESSHVRQYAVHAAGAYWNGFINLTVAGRLHIHLCRATGPLHYASQWTWVCVEGLIRHDRKQQLSPIRDYPLLRQVLRSTFITHGQLYEFMRLEYCATSRNAFNNRVLRLVKHDHLVRDEVPFRTEGCVYSISARGAAELAGLGEYYTELPRRSVDGQLPKTVYHAIDLNEIHLALKRSEQLVQWVPDTEIRSRNEFTDSGYKKDYDAVVTLRSNGSERTFALEYERTAKAHKEYLQIRNHIEAEAAVAKFLYLVPNYDLLSYIASFFATSKRAIYFGLFPDFLNHLFETPLRSVKPAPLSTLRDMLWAT